MDQPTPTLPPADLDPVASDVAAVTDVEPDPAETLLVTDVEPALAAEPALTDVAATAEAEPALTDVAAAPIEVAEPIAMEAPATDAPADETPATEAVVDEAPAAEPSAEAPEAEAAAPETATAAEAAPPAAPPQKKPVDEARRLRAQQAWERVVAAKASNESLTGTVTVAVKGGLLVDVGGIRGFLPASQVRVPLGTAIDTLVRTKVPLRVLDIDEDRRRIVVSHRRAVEDERRVKRAALLQSLEVGQVREGVVARLADFGAFVDLGGVDGLVPMRELAFERIEKAADVVQIGETISVEVLRIEENGKKISLSRKNALPDPWRDHAALLKQGTVIEGTVVAKEPSLRVELAPGVVGSVRESDANPADYEIGEKMEVAIRFVDRRQRRISLTTPHAQLEPPPQYTTSSGFAPLGVELGRR
jgi:predicted RNA-binding protein with RPS1 domain